VEPEETRELFRGEFLRVDLERWTEPDTTREVMRHPGAAAVLALTRDELLILTRQRREAVREMLLEIPAGIYDEDEPPEETARREVLEETGYRVVSLSPLLRLHTSPGFVDESIDLFVAEVEQEGEPEEGIEVVELPFDEAVKLVVDGKIPDAKSAIAILVGWARRHPPAFGATAPQT
jgi:ADP-ribose pyrophosphatase